MAMQTSHEPVSCHLGTLLLALVVSTANAGDDGSATLDPVGRDWIRLSAFDDVEPTSKIVESSPAPGDGVVLAGATELPDELAAPDSSGDVEELQFGLATLQASVKSLQDRMTITTRGDRWKLTVDGRFSGEMIYSEQRPVIPSSIVFISPDRGRNTPTVDVHGKSSLLGFRLDGPEILGLQSGGVLATSFFGETFLADETGFFIVAGFLELKDEKWRYSFGQQADVINPLFPYTLDFNKGQGAGNLGFLRGQFRVERHGKLWDEADWAVKLAIGNPISTSFTSNVRTLVEDNGWPNADGRVSIALGETTGCDGATTHRVELGLGGVVGQLRRVRVTADVADVWAVGVDARVVLTDWLGVKGELFTGHAIGNYNAAVIQIFNPVTGEGIRTTGGWGEVEVYWLPELHSHFGAGVDDPRDSQLAPSQRSRNSFRFANLIWDVTEDLEWGIEVAHYETDYVFAVLDDGRPVRSNDAFVYRTRVLIKF